MTATNKILLLFVFLIPSKIFADTHYVSCSGDDIFPYTNWTTAAHTIQDAVDAAIDGDTVLVTNGAYKTGGTNAAGFTLMNRVMINKEILVKSVNGPKKTKIIGKKNGNTENARCVYIEGKALLAGFTLKKGATLITEHSDIFDSCGGGAFVVAGGIISNCHFYNNKTYNNYSYGGGIFAYDAVVTHCEIFKNSAFLGGGIYSVFSEIINCDIFNNRASLNYWDAEEEGWYQTGNGGGIFCEESFIRNCTLKRNRSPVSGAGIDAFKTLITGCEISRNKVGAKHPSGYRPFGGAGICASSCIISNCFVSKNTVANKVLSNGGGINAWDSKIFNCVITGNKATRGKKYGVGGGGVWADDIYLNEKNVELVNCVIAKNKTKGKAAKGGGVHFCIINNCTISKNSADGKDSYGGGATKSLFTNSIVYFNSARESENYDTNCFFAYSCSFPKPAGNGNIDNDPLFVKVKKQDYHLQLNSSCINSGINLDWMYEGKDIDGNARLYAEVDMGPYELQGKLACNFTAKPYAGLAPLKVIFTSFVSGSKTSGIIYKWDFDNDGTTDVEGANCRIVTNTYSDVGVYSVNLEVENSYGDKANSLWQNCIQTFFPSHYVSKNGNHVLPFATWATAATSINAAAEIAFSGSSITVSNGIYELPSQLELACATILKSVFGPENTIIDGHGAFRCLYLKNTNIVIEGFTITNGTANNGGGIWCTTNSVITNCIISGNSSTAKGAGVFLSGGGNVRGCYINENVVDGSSYGDGGGGVYCYYGGTVQDCVITGNLSNSDDGGGSGGGAYCNEGGTIQNCTISGNFATDTGGGLDCPSGAAVKYCYIKDNQSNLGGGVRCGPGSFVQNSLLTENSATYSGGGAYCFSGGTIQNCTISKNSAVQGAGVRSRYSYVQNCIVYYNSPSNFYGENLEYSCTFPLFPGEGNISNNPEFVNFAGNNFHLEFPSPCIDAGTNAYAPGTTDLAGHPRIFSGTVDMGAYEYIPEPTGIWIVGVLECWIIVKHRKRLMSND